MQLNEGANKFTAMVKLPSSNIVRLVQGLGFGTSAIGNTSPVTGKVLMLSGEGDEALGVPECLCLPASIRSCRQVNCHTGTRLQEHLQQNANPSAWHRFVSSRILSEEKEIVMQIATIPAFLVYDGFNIDLRAEEVYEWVISLDDQTQEWVGHTKVFLKACVIKNLVSKDKPYVDNKIFHRLTP
eukprot:14277416-Ditylum_brightwellii.AAC.1